MGALGGIKDLAEELGLAEWKVRSWKDKGIFDPIDRDEDDGKSLLFDLRCERIRFKITRGLRLHFKLKEIGDRLQRVFGEQNSTLISELQNVRNDDKVIEKYMQECKSLDMDHD